MGQSKGWTQALTIVAFINDPETFEIAIVVLLELERILYKRNGKDSVTLKDLGGVLKAMAYMHMAAGHKEDAALTFRKAMYVYSLLYANDPASLESEKKQIADICEAASRAELQKWDHIEYAKVRDFVDKLIMNKMKNRQFDDADLTIGELTIVCDVIASSN